MTPQELADNINDHLHDAVARVENNFVILPLFGYELVFHSLTSYGSGEWFINDTAD